MRWSIRWGSRESARSGRSVPLRRSPTPCSTRRVGGSRRRCDVTSVLAKQPWLGLAGLLFVLPIAALLAFAGGPETAVRVLGPLVATGLAPVAMVAFWWNRWPGTTLRPAWSGWVDTVVIAVLALALALVGQVVVGRADLRGLVDPTPGVGHTPTYPVLIPIGAAAFTAMLQLTQVIEGWP